MAHRARPGGVLLWIAAGLLPLAARSETRVTMGTYLEQIAAAQRMTAGCSASPAACGAAGLPETETVDGGAAGQFAAEWMWMREAMSGAAKASAAERASSMRAVSEHLDELVREAGQNRPGAEADFQRVRAAAQAVLARPEFRADEGPSWLDRQIARLQDWLSRVFLGMGRLGRRAPWLAPLVEWGCFGLAAAGLLWFVRQSAAREALRLALSGGAGLDGGRQADGTAWAQRAEERAAAADWREAVHCLYWAAIAALESRGTWRRNAARTPREYLRLLPAGSEAEAALRTLTRSFEQVWYGHGAASEAVYRDARESFGRLETARPGRRGIEGALPVAENA